MLNRKAQRDFVRKITPAARDAQAKWGVPASVIVAQAIRESDWGTSWLGRVAHNYFGIKTNAEKKYAELPANEFDQPKTGRFCRYSDPRISIGEHARLLGTLDRYRPAMVDCDDAIVFAVRLKECGYSADPHYVKAIETLITYCASLENAKKRGAR